VAGVLDYKEPGITFGARHRAMLNPGRHVNKRHYRRIQLAAVNFPDQSSLDDKIELFIGMRMQFGTGSTTFAYQAHLETLAMDRRSERTGFARNEIPRGNGCAAFALRSLVKLGNPVYITNQAPRHIGTRRLYWWLQFATEMRKQLAYFVNRILFVMPLPYHHKTGSPLTGNDEAERNAFRDMQHVMPGNLHNLAIDIDGNLALQNKIKLLARQRLKQCA